MERERVVPYDRDLTQLGDLDLGEYLDRFRNQRLVIAVAPVGQTDTETYTCGICGFAYNEYAECPRCKTQIADATGQANKPGDILDQVMELLDGSG